MDEKRKKLDMLNAVSHQPCNNHISVYDNKFLGFVLFVSVEALHPSQHFSVMSGQRHCFLGITSTFWEVNVSCSKIQHGDLSEDRTLGFVRQS